MSINPAALAFEALNMKQRVIGGVLCALTTAVSVYGIASSASVWFTLSAMTLGTATTLVAIIVLRNKCATKY